MSLNRHDVRRDANESPIVDALRRVGCTVIRLDDIDLLVGRAGKNYLLEVKVASGTLTLKQQRFRDWWRGQFVIVRTIDEALKAVGVMQ